MGVSCVLMQSRQLMMRIGRSLLAGAVLLLAACTEPTDPVAVATIQLLPGLDSVEVGQTYSGWVVTLRDANGDIITGRTPTWESLHPEVATVDDNGVVTGVTSGGANISATIEGKSALATIKVLEPILSIIATPDSFDLPLTTSRTIAVQLVGPGGQALSNRTVTWATSDPGIASVSSVGMVTPIAAGTVTVTIYAGTKMATVRVRVVAEPASSVRITPQQPVHVVRLGQAIQLTAECLNSTSQVLVGRPVTWNSSNPVVATVSGTGLVSGGALGQANISATCVNVGTGNASAQVSVQVTLVPVSSVSITPSPVNLFVGWPGQQLTATARDSAQNVLSLQGRSVVWSSDNLPVATVSNQGVVAGVMTGLAHVQVAVDGVSSAAINVSVQNAPVASVVVTVPPQLKVGSAHQMSVTLRDAQGNVLSGRVVTWSSSNQGVATIDGNGVVQAVSAGPTNITAISEGVVSLPVQLTVIP